MFLNIFKTKYSTKSTSVSQCSPANMPAQLCCKRAGTILYYYFHIKEDKNYIRMYTKTHQIVPLFKNFLEGTCPLNIQYTERSNYIPCVQYNYVCIRNEKF